MRQQPWAASPLTVEVHDGVVAFHGFSPSLSVQRGCACWLNKCVHGVKQVSDQTVPMPADIYGYGAY